MSTLHLQNIQAGSLDPLALFVAGGFNSFMCTVHIVKSLVPMKNTWIQFQCWFVVTEDGKDKRKCLRCFTVLPVVKVPHFIYSSDIQCLLGNMWASWHGFGKNIKRNHKQHVRCYSLQGDNIWITCECSPLNRWVTLDLRSLWCNS